MLNSDLSIGSSFFPNRPSVITLLSEDNNKTQHYPNSLFVSIFHSYLFLKWMCNMCFLPYAGISARIFAKWLELPTLNEINDLIETGFVQTTKRRTLSLYPMIQELNCLLKTKNILKELSKYMKRSGLMNQKWLKQNIRKFRSYIHRLGFHEYEYNFYFFPYLRKLL